MANRGINNRMHLTHSLPVQRRRRWSAAEKGRLVAASLELGQAAAGDVLQW